MLFYLGEQASSELVCTRHGQISIMSNGFSANVRFKTLEIIMEACTGVPSDLPLFTLTGLPR